MHDTTEEYLESILAIEEEGVVPMRARLVERLGLSAAAVSETVGRLSDHGYVELHGDRSLHLTDKGRRLATTVVRRHRLAERLLVDVIGLEWEKVHREADRWEHAISADVEEKLVELLGDPATCPHGNPIPGSKHQANGAPDGRARAQRPRPDHRATRQRTARDRRRRHPPARGRAHDARLRGDGRRGRRRRRSRVDTETGRHTLPQPRRRRTSTSVERSTSAD